MTIKFKKKTLTTILLVLILLLALFLRLYKIRDYIVFLGDQGRDVLEVKKILEGDLTLLGPTASVGGFYLGPFYYYLMAIPLWLAGFDPVGPAVMVALFGVATVFLIFIFLRQLFGNLVALFASFLYAFSPLAVANSRFSWNPNTLPFFSLLFFYLLFLARGKKRKPFLFLSGIILGICFQLHYLALSLLPLGIILTFKKRFRQWLIDFSFLLFGCFLSFSPFLFFELNHGFANIKSIFEFVTRRGGAIGFYPLSLLGHLSELSLRIFASIFGFEKNLFIKLLTFASLIILLSELKKKKKVVWPFLVWWLGGVFVLSFYQGTIYDYYYGYLYPIPAVSLGIFLGFLAKKRNSFFKLFSLAIFLFILFFSLKRQVIWTKPNRILIQTERIAESIIERSQDKAFNFALISQSNSDHAYRYFLEVKKHKPVSLGERVEEQLFVVCESVVCQPLGHPLWEIAAFGRAEIVEEWKDEVGIRIFRLVHHADSIDLIGEPAPKGI